MNVGSGSTRFALPRKNGAPRRRFSLGCNGIGRTRSYLKVQSSICLMATPIAGDQFHPRIEQRTHSMGILYERARFAVAASMLIASSSERKWWHEHDSCEDKDAPYCGRLMNNPTLITGCQRSGTTLLHLSLDSHPDITGVDEIGFGKVPLSDYLNRPEFHPYVSFKLPVVSFRAEFIRTIPGIKVLWCIRDPRDVVLSMMNLQLRISADALLPWVVHSAGAGREIENSAGTLKKIMSAELASCYATFRNIAAKSPESWQTGDKVYVGALCWRMKQELLEVYRQLGIPYRILHYEKLISD